MQAAHIPESSQCFTLLSTVCSSPLWEKNLHLYLESTQLQSIILAFPRPSCRLISDTLAQLTASTIAVLFLSSCSILGCKRPEVAVVPPAPPRGTTVPSPMLVQNEKLLNRLLEEVSLSASLSLASLLAFWMALALLSVAEGSSAAYVYVTYRGVYIIPNRRDPPQQWTDLRINHTRTLTEPHASLPTARSS